MESISSDKRDVVLDILQQIKDSIVYIYKSPPCEVTF